MTIQTVNIGSTPNDGTGDDPRTGISKLNANFTDSANAASKLVQTDPTDATPDRVMLNGAHGLGDNSQSVYSGDCNDLTVGSMRYVSSGAANSPASIGAGSGSLITVGMTSIRKTQLWQDLAARVYVRSNNSGTWSAWQPVYTGANYQPETSLNGLGVVRLMKNVSGGSVLNNGTISGANLRVSYVNSAGTTIATSSLAPSGTWKNVAGLDIANNQHATFVRIA